MYHADGNLRQRTFDFARRITRLVSALPTTRSTRVFADQLLRSGTSVGANYREAQRSRSNAELRSKLGDCLREADEALYWMELLEAEQLVPASRLSKIKDENVQLIAIFVALLRAKKR
jgi:four helix bundle protein